MLSGMKRVQKRYFLLVTATVWVLAACAPVQTVEDEQEATIPLPKLIWEKTFEEAIYGVGIDEECFEASGGSIDSCLKWVVLGRGPEGQVHKTTLWWFDNGRRIGREPLGDFFDCFIEPCERHILVVSKLAGGARRYRLLDSEGREVWEFEVERDSNPFVRSDGSAVLVSSETKGRREYRTIVRFLFPDGRGRVTSIEDTIESFGLPGSISKGFFTLTADARGRLYNKAGEILWDQEAPDAKIIPTLVTDRGFALFATSSGDSTAGRTLVYNPDGTIRCEFPFVLWGITAAAFGDTVFGGMEHLLCYDLKGRRIVFALRPDQGYLFGCLDADLRQELVAVVIHRQSEYATILPWAESLRIYGFDGTLLWEIPIENGFPLRADLLIRSPTPPPIRLLGGKLLVLDGKKLKLYDLDLD